MSKDGNKSGNKVATAKALNNTVGSILKLLDENDYRPAQGLGKIEADVKAKDLIPLLKAFKKQHKESKDFDDEQQKILLKEFETFHADLLTWQPQSYLAQKQYQKTYGLLQVLRNPEKFCEDMQKSAVAINSGIKGDIVESIIEKVLNGVNETNEAQTNELKKQLQNAFKQLDPDYVRDNKSVLIKNITKDLQKKHQRKTIHGVLKFTISEKNSKRYADKLVKEYAPKSIDHAEQTIFNNLKKSGLIHGNKLDEGSLKKILFEFIAENKPKSRLNPYNLPDIKT